MKTDDKKFLAEIERVRNVIQTYSFQRNGVAKYKVKVYTNILNDALNESSQKKRKVLYNTLLMIK